MSVLASLRSAATLSDVAKLVGFEPSHLSYVLYVKNASDNYKSFTIPKKHGGIRQISAPVAHLKLIQRAVAELLQDCIAEIDVENKFDGQISHGFTRGRSIITNAAKHRARRFVFNVDLADFFGSINFGRVRGYFLSNKHLKLNERVATVLAQIVCYQNSLPQGSPASPVVSNLIGHVLDMRLVRLAQLNGCTYSRYADDLTFSTNARKFPEGIARVGARQHSWVVGPTLERVIEGSGFAINSAKTRMQYRDSRQDVTGLVVNRKVNVPIGYRRTVRAMVHRLVQSGSFEFIHHVTDETGVTTEVLVPGDPTQLHGMLAHIEWVDAYNEVLRKRATPDETRDESSREKTFRKFLLFKDFYANEKPVLICEGATDNIYLTHAIRSLAKDFPQLTKIETDGTISLKVRIYKYAERCTGRILGIHGGTGALNKLISEYHKEKTRFKAAGELYPVLLMVDNDSGAESIFSSYTKITKSKISGAEKFLHMYGNLYVVPTLLPPGAKQSCIEDCFDAKAKAMSFEGKTFDGGKKIDTEKHFGKTIFAHRIVQPNAGTIDFKGFKPLLESVVAAIEFHAKLKTSDAKVPGSRDGVVAK
jgi:RNA-directed DNA polymerase